MAQAQALGRRAQALALDLVNEMGRSVSMQRKQASTGGRGWTGEGALDPGDGRRLLPLVAASWRSWVPGQREIHEEERKTGRERSRGLALICGRRRRQDEVASGYAGGSRRRHRARNAGGEVAEGFGGWDSSPQF